MKRLRLLACVTVCVFALGACTKYHDALVVNPCSKPFFVLLSDGPVPPKGKGETIPPVHTVRVGNAFTDQSQRAHSARVTDSKGREHVLTIPFASDDPIVVLIPASFC